MGGGRRLFGGAAVAAVLGVAVTAALIALVSLPARSAGAAERPAYGPNHPAVRQPPAQARPLPAPPEGASPVGPNGFVCDVFHRASGTTLRAIHLRGPTQRWVAEARRDPQPTIVYSPSFYSFDTAMQRFIQYHECGHLAVPTSNEFAANCYALERMRQEGTLTPEVLRHIRRVVSSSGMIPSNYGGSGREFWKGTESYCPTAAGAP